MGNVLKQVNLPAAVQGVSNGKGSLNTDALNLASGTYSYSLYADGRLIETKQMVVAK